MVSVATAAMAVTPAAVPAAEVGINPVFQSAGQGLDAMGQLGATWVRAFVRWDQVEPAGPDRWDAGALADLEQYTAVAQLRGIKVVAVVVGAPQWASGAAEPSAAARPGGLGTHGRARGA